MNLLKSAALLGTLAFIAFSTAPRQTSAQTNDAAQNPPAAPATSTTPEDADSIVEDFRKPPKKPWRWIRENRDGWRITDDGLQVLIEPGNMWGGDNDARNVLVRPIPAEWRDGVEVIVQFEHHPKKRWEQADLVWYYNDGTMVKLGLEVENDQLNIVMGREEKDQARTVAVIPYGKNTVQLRLVVDGRKIAGAYRVPGEKKWTTAGDCELPSPPDGEAPHASLQFYQGDAGSDRWATVSKFRIVKQPAKNP